MPFFPKIISFFSLLIFLTSCHSSSATHKENKPEHHFENRQIQLKDSIYYFSGSTYLSVYPQVYSLSEHKTRNLTVTVSMKNTYLTDSVFITKAQYYNTSGQCIQNYIKTPIYILPMETIEIVIDEVDESGGTGANFIFDWKSNSKFQEPLFEGIMISTSGQQGISFTTQGKRIQ